MKMEVDYTMAWRNDEGLGFVFGGTLFEGKARQLTIEAGAPLDRAASMVAGNG